MVAHTLVPHVDFQLDYVIRACLLEPPSADRRLNVIENTLAALEFQWRPARPQVPAEELGIAPETLAQLPGWVESEEAASGRTAARLAQYRHSVDEGMLRGWVRVWLMQ